MRQGNSALCPQVKCAVQSLPQILPFLEAGWGHSAWLTCLGTSFKFPNCPRLQNVFWKSRFSYTKQHLRKSKRLIFSRFLKPSTTPIHASRAQPSLSISVWDLQRAGHGTKREAQIKDVFWAEPLVGRGPVWLNCFVPH